jgi:putative ABC transport system permease protein
MSIRDLVIEVYIALMSNKTRSGLTVLGIVIGIASVVVMMAIGNGSQKTIEESIESIGSNLLMVYPGQQRSFGSGVRQAMGTASSLTMEDAVKIAEKIEGVEGVAVETSSRYQVTSKGSNSNVSVYGVGENYPEVKNLDIDDGKFFTVKQNDTNAKVAILGPTTRDDLFGENYDAIGQKIKINSIEFSVIGISASKGGSSMGSSDEIIYVPINTMQKFLTGNKTVSTIDVKISDEGLMTTAETEITNLLLKEHGKKDADSADFRVFNQSDIVETASSVTSTFTLLLGAIAAISLVVGGIGIMNMMLTSVTERTREIGLRKAIGAKSEYIVSQFLAESAILTVIGGVLGVLFAWVIAWGATKFFGLATEISWSSVGLVVAVSMVIGIVFGYYPALKAAKLNPIEALRYQ